MSAPMARRVSWTLWGVGVIAIAVAAVLAARYPFTSLQETYEPVGETLWAASWLGFGLVGALIVSRRPDNRIGWLLVAITATLSIGVMSTIYGRVAYQHPEVGLPLGPFATWIAMWVVNLTFGAVVALLLLFPSGALVARRQRWLAAALVVVVAATCVVHALLPKAPEGDAPPFNPLGVESLEATLTAATGILGMAFAIVAALVLADFIYRFWRSTGVARQQFRWLVLTATTFPVLFFVGVMLEDSLLSPDQFDPVSLVFFLCGNGLAAAIGVAVTRYGLYEIDRVISRSVTYVLLTAVLVAVYLAAVTVLTAATAPVTGDSPLAVAAATLLAAAAFGPARRRIQSAVDRRFNRSRYDAVRTVDSYRSRLRDEVNLETVAADLLGVVHSSMQPSEARLWLAGANPPKNSPVQPVP